jgi:hypothetical protein
VATFYTILEPMTIMRTRGICVCGGTKLDVGVEWNAILYEGEAWHSLAKKVGMLGKERAEED